MYFDRFDIVEAYYLFFVAYHEGQYSEKYARLSKMSTYFRPAMGLSLKELSKNALLIYANLVQKERRKMKKGSK